MLTFESACGDRKISSTLVTILSNNSYLGPLQAN